MRRATSDDGAQVGLCLISIHALHEESDRDDVAVASAVVISIHALHEESDPPPSGLVSPMANFNPRSP